MSKSKASDTKAAAKAIMDLIPEDTTEAVLASVKRQVAMRLNKLRADGLELNRQSITLGQFDKAIAFFVDRYETPAGGLPPSQLAYANRILESVKLRAEDAEDYGRWLATQEWFCNAPNQKRALNGLNNNLMTAKRYGDYVRATEERRMLCIYEK